MVNVEDYERLVEEILEEFSSYKPAYGEVEVQTVVDRQSQHYQLQYVGWHQNQRVRGCVLHIDIKNNKIWIQHDGTEDGVANVLVAHGVPKGDIVLAFHSPFKRQFTEFAVN
jgi:hypothetical protein